MLVELEVVAVKVVSVDEETGAVVVAGRSIFFSKLDSGKAPKSKLPSRMELGPEVAVLSTAAGEAGVII